MSANNVMWCMKYEDSYHVFYSGCVDDDPKKPDYKNGYYKNFVDRNKALIYAHDTVNKIDKECNEIGFSGVEYGVMEISIVKPLSNAKGVLSELIKLVGELQFKVGEVEKTVGILLGHANSVHTLSVGNRAMIVKVKEEVKALEKKYDNRTHLNLNRVRNNEEILRELLNRIGWDFDTHNIYLKDFIPTNWKALLLKKLKSGGEKEDGWTALRGNQKAVSGGSALPQNSKLPETKNEPIMFDCLKCSKSFEALKDYDKDGNISSICQICRDKETKPEKDCNECEFYGECDHQGAYQLDGKWCYEPKTEKKEDKPSYSKSDLYYYKKLYEMNEKLDPDKRQVLIDPKIIEEKLAVKLISKASGGEKEDSARHVQPHSNLIEVKSADNQSENSKPTEPKKRSLKDSDWYTNEPKKAVEPQRKDYNRLLVTCSKCSYKWLVNIEHVQKDQQEEDYKKFYEDILACRGMCYKEMVNYLVELEEKYDEE